MKTAVSLAFILFSVLGSADSIVAQKSRTAEAKLAATSAKSTRFESLTAISDGRSTWLTWNMEVEVGNIGFNVYRIDRGTVESLTPVRIVNGAAMRAREIAQYGQSYSFYDHVGNGTSAYYVETIGLHGDRLTSPQIYPTYVPSLSAATGLSRRQMVSTMYRPVTLEDTAPAFTRDLVTEIEENRQLADSSVHRMVISQPGVARIGVKGQGIFRVTRAQLEAAGFNVVSNPSNWQLYIEGVEQAIIVEENGNYIDFYGKGADTPETDIRVYYLMNGGSPGKRMLQQVAHPNTSTVVTRSYSQTFVKKERTNFVDDIINGETENYFGRAITSNPNAAPMTFNLSGVDFAVSTVSMQLSFQGYSNTNHSVEVILNGEVLPSATGAGENNFSRSYSIPTSFLREGANSIKFRAIGDPNDFVFFDTLSIPFNRRFLAEGNRLNFYTQNYRSAQLEGFASANIRVFDITRDGNPVLMNNLVFQQNGSTFGTNMPPARGRSLFAVEDSGILAPASVTPNNPELVGVPGPAVNLVIVAYKDFMTQAETWATYRRSQGLTVEVVEVSELFDEFNYGQFGSSAITGFLQYARQNWQTDYALMIGDAAWDSRNYEDTGYWNLIPAKMVSTVYSETASDDALADFNDDGLAEVAMGRVPARTVDEVNIVYSKTVNWEAALTPTSMNRGALFAYDFNQGYLFDAMSQRLSNQLPVTTPSTFVFRGEANANTNLVSAMNSGKYVVNYSGHGTAGSWGGSPVFFNVFSVPTTADHNPSIYTMLTCLNGYYHWQYFPSIAEVLLFTPNKGAVIAWGSSGLTLPNFQENMATRFYLKLGEGNIPRMGDLVRDAKFAVSGRDVRNSWALLGDPMLKVR